MYNTHQFPIKFWLASYTQQQHKELNESLTWLSEVMRAGEAIQLTVLEVA